MVIKVLKENKFYAFHEFDTIKEAKSYYKWVSPKTKGLKFEVVK